MGAAASVILPFVASTIVGLISRLFTSPNHENQTNQDLENHHRREEEKRWVEEEIRRQNEEVQRKKEECDRLEREMREHREKMEKETKEAEKRRKEEAQKREEERKEHEERKQRFERKKIEHEARMEKEKQQERERLQREHDQKQKEEREKMRREKQAELERLQREHERKQKQERERLEQEMKEQAARVEKERAVECLKMQQEQERIETELKRMAEEQRIAEERLKRRLAEKEELYKEHIKQLEKGISPKVWPTQEEWMRARARLIGGKDKFHCAVAGNSGSGKSSLINALRGVRNNNSKAAAVGVVETTQDICAYPDPSSLPHRNKFVWYDVPGAGTLNIPGPQYFNSQGLFVFDFIIVVVDIRLTAQDIAILQNCDYFKIPSFIVRSKANQHIRNIIEEELKKEDDSDTDEDKEIEEAKQRLVTKTRESYRKNLREGGLNPDQRVYIVSAEGIRSFVSLTLDTEEVMEKFTRKVKKANYLVDEAELVQDLLKAIIARKYD